MKKCATALVVAVIALMGNAATASWKMSAKGIYDGTGSTEDANKISASAYLFDAGITSQSALYALIAAGTSVSSSTAGYVGSLSVSGGTISSTTVAYGEQSVSGTSNTYAFYFAIIDDDKVFFSAEKELAANGTATAKTVAFGTQSDSSLAITGTGYQGAGKWSAVPEPTSGLLMLLGMAGLALRRRDA